VYIHNSRVRGGKSPGLLLHLFSDKGGNI
jgi:hypothetical protein